MPDNGVRCATQKTPSLRVRLQRRRSYFAGARSGIHTSQGVNMSDKLAEIIAEALAFRNERDWERFHDPKNLAEAISIEAGELLENFLWVTTDESREMEGAKLDRIKNEVSDILIYVIYLCQALNIDLIKEARNKLQMNRQKYPVEKSKGSSKKYTEF